MMGYAKDPSIKLGDVFVTPVSFKLLTFCRSLRKKKIIKRFRLTNAGILKAKIIQLYNSECTRHNVWSCSTLVLTQPGQSDLVGFE